MRKRRCDPLAQPALRSAIRLTLPGFRMRLFVRLFACGTLR
jgi:hypothetical protein